MATITIPEKLYQDLVETAQATGIPLEELIQDTLRGLVFSPEVQTPISTAERERLRAVGDRLHPPLSEEVMHERGERA